MPLILDECACQDNLDDIVGFADFSVDIEEDCKPLLVLVLLAT